MGTTCGFRLYSLSPFFEVLNSEKLPEADQRTFVGGISQIATLYKTQIMALVGLNSNKKLGDQSVIKRRM